MTDRQKIVGKSLGLNTNLDPFQAQDEIDSKGNSTPNRHLSRAIGIKVTDSGNIERADPTTHHIDLANGHSLFCDQTDCLVHDGGSMYRVETTLELSAALRTGMSGDRVGHTKYGEAVYFGNRQERGVYYQGSARIWDGDIYKGPITSRTLWSTAPVFDHLAAFNGMILFSYDNHLFATEVGKPGLWEPVPVWSTDTRITMIKPVVTDTFPVTGGIFVSDEKRISYLGGLLDDGTRKFAEPRTTNYPAIEWAVVHGYIDGTTLGQKSGLCAVFGTTQGLCIGYPDGQLVNITQEKIKIPSGLISGAVGITDHHIITTLR